MARRRDDGIPALGSNIEASADAAGATPQRGVVSSKPDVEAFPAGLHAPGLLQRAMGCREVLEAVEASIGRIDIEHPNTCSCTGSHGDIGLWPFLPPALNAVGITGGVVE